ncbi:MAG: 4-aminobutyrate--2-oxoglutarate transaminase [Candidatus Lindowbacteria bacterium]|nr:4-aminobutyrate--2-oxoglutarate transaminase [Candidatus Lindowbacteria bacterium]
MNRTTDELLAAREKNVPQGVFNIHPIFAKSAKDATVTSIDGKEYIDFAGGIGTVNAGHCPDAVLKAISDQIEKYLHTCFHVVMYEPYIELAEKLNALTPGGFAKKTMFANSGAEAVENSVKIARYYTRRTGVICFEQGFHGRTLLAMSLTSKVKPYKFGFGPFAPEIYRMPAAYCYRCAFGLTYPSCELVCAKRLEDFFINNAAAEHIAALIIEPVAGEGGFIVPPKDYLIRLQEICKKNGIAFIIDEIQSGIGRTGKLFASEHFGIEPDIILTAKSLAAGIPLAGVTGRAEIMDSPHVGGLGGTFGGNPVACRSALAVLDLVEKHNLLECAQAIGEKVKTCLEKWKESYTIVADVRGLGAMMAVELVEDRKTKEPAADRTKYIVTACREEGLLTLSCGNHGNVIRILAPLVITDEQLEKGLRILEKAIRKANEGL